MSPVLAGRRAAMRRAVRARVEARAIAALARHVDPIAVAAAVHYVSTACIDAHRLNRPELAARCRARCKHCAQLCACGRSTSTAPTLEQVTAALREAQVALWADLGDAVRHAHVDPPVVPGHWSVRCEGIAERIVDNASLVGPVGWPHIQPDLLLHGVYEKLLHDAGLEWPPVEWDQVLDLYNRHHPTGWVGPPVRLIGTIDPERP